ncbi:MAG: type II toxin-antitoxin system VapC family toxin [Methylibium sp.]|nr:type II toxin-antitoxin system VapC family toxin [Methylibium sp.]MBA3597251.1 type II toxin-antitoxin system VapC family toxin [Methylibium sp.]
MTVEDLSSVVLDTHALVWLMQGSERVGPRSRELIAAATEADAVFVAAISAWEIAMLVAKGRLALDRDVGTWLDAALRLQGLRLAALDPLVAVDSTRLPGDVHGDPADRLIVATARRHAAVLITDDRQILQYGAAGHVKAHRAGA